MRRRRQSIARAAFHNLLTSLGATEVIANLKTHPEIEQAADLYNRLNNQWKAMCNAIRLLDLPVWRVPARPSPVEPLELVPARTSTTWVMEPTPGLEPGTTVYEPSTAETGFSVSLSGKWRGPAKCGGVCWEDSG
jgi:hypothetical protein